MKFKYGLAMILATILLATWAPAIADSTGYGEVSGSIAVEQVVQGIDVTVERTDVACADLFGLNGTSTVAGVYPAFTRTIVDRSEVRPARDGFGAVAYGITDRELYDLAADGDDTPLVHPLLC